MVFVFRICWVSQQLGHSDARATAQRRNGWLNGPTAGLAPAGSQRPMTNAQRLTAHRPVMPCVSPNAPPRLCASVLKMIPLFLFTFINLISLLNTIYFRYFKYNSFPPAYPGFLVKCLNGYPVVTVCFTPKAFFKELLSFASITCAPRLLAFSAKLTGSFSPERRPVFLSL